MGLGLHQSRGAHVEPSRAHVSGSPFGDPATVSVADTGAGLCVWVNWATGQLGNRATGAKGTTGQLGDSRRARRRHNLPIFLPSDLRIFLSSYLPTFLPPVVQEIRRRRREAVVGVQVGA